MLFLCCHDWRVCAVFQFSFLVPFVGFLEWWCNAGACPPMMVPLPVPYFSGFCCLRYSLNPWSVVAIFLIHSQIFVVSSWIMVLTLTSPRRPYFRFACRLREGASLSWSQWGQILGKSRTWWQLVLWFKVVLQSCSKCKSGRRVD